MRILFTGGTNRQVKPPEQRGHSVSKIDVPEYIVRSMLAAGHTVEWRAVTPGEDLSHFDVIWVGFAGFLSRNSPNTLGVLWAWHSNVPKVAFLDDWAWHQSFSHLRTIAKRPMHYLNRPDFFSGALKWSDEEVHRYASTVCDKDAAFYMADPALWPENITIVCPMYEFGNLEPVRTHPEWKGRAMNDIAMTKLDPSGYVIQTELRGCRDYEFGIKKREWACASLSDQSGWAEKQKFEWPVHWYGTRKLKAERLESEWDVLHAYAAAEGVLAPPYSRLIGTGWFRSRHLYSAIAGSYLYCDPGDVVGGKYHTPREIESMHTGARDYVIGEQREAVLEGIWTTQEFDIRVQEINQYTALLPR